MLVLVKTVFLVNNNLIAIDDDLGFRQGRFHWESGPEDLGELLQSPVRSLDKVPVDESHSQDIPDDEPDVIAPADVVERDRCHLPIIEIEG